MFSKWSPSFNLTEQKSLMENNYFIIIWDSSRKVMSAINNQPKKSSSKNSTFIIGGVIAIAAVVLFAYLMFYTAPEENIELVKIIAITEDGCIAETLDGFAVNIGDCQAQPGEYVNALVDKKVKERAAMMNPTT